MSNPEHLALQTILKQLSKSLHKKKYDKPWILVVGPEQSGCSTLLEIITQYASEIESTKLNNTDTCDWYITPQAVFLNIVGKHVVNTRHGINPIQQVWRSLVNSLKKYRRRKPIDGLLLVFDIQHIISAQDDVLYNEVIALKQKIHTLQKKLGVRLSLHVAFTKCDLLPGFDDFFAHISQEDREQTLGFLLEKNLPNGFKQQWEQAYAGLLLRLNDRMLWRLQQVTDSQQAKQIEKFLMEMSILQVPLGKFIHLLCNDFILAQQVELHSCFFTSCKPTSSTAQLPHLNTSTENALQPISQPFAFFIKQLPQYIIQQTTSVPLKIIHKKIFAYIGYATLAALSIVLIAYMGRHFTSTLDQYEKIKSPVAHYRFLQTQLDTQTYEATSISPNAISKQHVIHRLNKALFALREIENIKQLIHKQKSNKLLAILQKKSQALITEKIYPSLLALAYQDLFMVAPGDLVSLHKQRRIYAMLAKQQTYQAQYIQSWLSNAWKIYELDEETHILLNKIIENLANTNQTPKYNKEIISLATEVLESADAHKKQLNLLDDTLANATIVNIYTDVNQAISIPNIYTQAGYQQIAALYNSKKINTDLWQFYQQDYVNFWQSTLRQIASREFLSFSQLNDYVKNLLRNKNLLITNLLSVYQQTSPLAQSIFETMQIDLLPEKEMEIFFAELARIQAITHKILTAKDTKQAAYDYFQQTQLYSPKPNVIIQIKDNAHELTPPLNTWLENIANNTQLLIEAQIKHYINQTWQRHVQTFYQQQLANYYPLNSTNPNYASIKNFDKFFSPQGISEKFYQNYLSEFIDTSISHWKPRTPRGYNVQLSSSIVKQLQMINQITHLFYDDTGKLQTQFTLQPIEASDNVKSVTMQIGETSIPYNLEDVEILLTWPQYKNNQQKIQISLITEDNKKYTRVFDGVWSIFKLLDSANVQATDDPKVYYLTFKINDATVKYSLQADNNLNPFMQHAIHSLVLPHNLF
jgi:type VI secretion system protein ImpL